MKNLLIYITFILTSLMIGVSDAWSLTSAYSTSGDDAIYIGDPVYMFSSNHNVNGSMCTLGAIAKDTNYEHYYGVTAMHCFRNSHTHEVEKTMVYKKTKNNEYELIGEYDPSMSDARLDIAVFQFTPYIYPKTKTRTGVNYNNLIDYKDMKLGKKICKIGATTKYTCGTLVFSDADDYDMFHIDSNHEVAEHGDSGSGVWETGDDGSHYLVGILIQKTCKDSNECSATQAVAAYAPTYFHEKNLILVP